MTVGVAVGTVVGVEAGLGVAVGTGVGVAVGVIAGVGVEAGVGVGDGIEAGVSVGEGAAAVSERTAPTAALGGNGSDWRWSQIPTSMMAKIKAMPETLRNLYLRSS